MSAPQTEDNNETENANELAPTSSDTGNEVQPQLIWNPYENSWSCFQQLFATKWNQLLVRFTARFPSLVNAWQTYQKLSGILHPSAEMLKNGTETPNWDEVPIRFLAPHPKLNWMALVTGEDKVLLFYDDDRMPTCVEHVQQQHVSCVVWRPSVITTWAVGCAAGIFIWLDVGCTKSIHGSPMYLLSNSGHTFVTSVQWNRDGSILASAALGTAYILLWDPDDGSCLNSLPFPNNCNTGYRILRYSPRYTWIFCAAQGVGASMWHIGSNEWRLQEIRVKGSVQSAAWSACGSFLFLSMKDSTRLYAAYCETSVFRGVKPKWKARFLINLERVPFGGRVFDCGVPQAIAIDPGNIYMALIFRDRPFVFLFILIARDPLELWPADIKQPSLSGAYPVCVRFSSMKETSRILAIAWSTGNVERWLLTPDYVLEHLNDIWVKPPQ
ncbi:aladin [Scaptodrosophila lebanonensis]|uniref:Aladin n=1 Tax=Drosophila lebanonensis TaxID=7225 RepID=A0A6J2U2T4_DROLE|nr:aladin [Scaptodrosophila lebanonensis]